MEENCRGPDKVLADLEMRCQKVLITGAAGNLGSLVSRFIVDHEEDLDLILMEHRTKVPEDVASNPRVRVRKADLSKPETLHACLEGADVIVHFAGVLFRANPEKFLHETNTLYFKNLVSAAKDKQIDKVILISFPHVEGPTSRKSPAKGSLNGNPISVHARTRLEEEKYLFREIEHSISLRVDRDAKNLIVGGCAHGYAYNAKETH